MARQTAIRLAGVLTIGCVVALILVLIFIYKRAVTNSPAAVGVLMIHHASEMPDPAGSSPITSEDFAKEQQKHVAALSQRSFLGEALQDSVVHAAILNTGWTKEFAGKENSFDARVDDLAAKFKAEAIPNTRLIRITISVASPHDGVAILTALGDFFMERFGRQEKNAESERIKQLTKEITTLEAELPAQGLAPAAEEQKKRDRIASLEQERDRLKNLRMAIGWKSVEWAEMPHAISAPAR